MIIGIADLGIGNFAAISKMLDQLGARPRRLEDPAEVHTVDRLILPGVGAFDYAAKVLDVKHWREPLNNLMQAQEMPILAVCVGMQLLAQSSAEGSGDGLGYISGTCQRFTQEPNSPLKVPHMGWSDIVAISDDPLVKSGEVERFYFAHSYYVDCSPQDAIATCDYGITFPAAVHKGLTWGVQFHPEKSHRFGLALLRRFVNLPC